VFEVLDGTVYITKHDLQSMRVGEELKFSVVNSWAVYMNFLEEKRKADEPSRFFFSIAASVSFYFPYIFFLFNNSGGVECVNMYLTFCILFIIRST
jgi:hypothetical protein